MRTQTCSLTPEDIGFLESAGFHLDDERRSFLFSDKSTVVHAVPGSGKTTVLGLKLCGLIRKWPFKNRGVCVISHTNAARDEILKISRELGVESIIGAYPHFVGTIQTFVDGFLSMPWLRRKGISEISVSRGEFVATAKRASFRPEFAKLRIHLSKSYPRMADSLDLLEKLYYTDADLNVNNICACGPGADSYKQMLALKEHLHRRGFFLFEDMYAIALKALRESGELRRILQDRFPFVFVDEFQDNSDLQELLLSSAFEDSAGGSVVQKLGDTDQAIYRERAAVARDAGMIPVTKTFRFGSSIATIASAFQSSVRCGIVSANSNASRSKVCAILFDSVSISEVIEVFGSLVAQYVDLPGQALVAKAVGYKRNSDEQVDPPLPSTIWDYVPRGSDGMLGVGRAGFGRAGVGVFTHRDLILTAICSVRCGRFYDAWINLLRAARTLCGVSGASAPFGAELENELQRASQEYFRKWRIWLACEFMAMSSVEQVESCLLTFFHPVGAKAVRVPQGRAPVDLRNGDQGDTEPALVWRTRSNVDVHVSTIHSVKGETHDATLVLETKHYEFDLSHCINKVGASFVEASRTSRKKAWKPGIREGQHMRRLYVAMTRPRRLLCLAMSGSLLGPDGFCWLNEHNVEIVDLRGK